MLVAPVGCDIRLVPDLINPHSVVIAFCKARCKAGKSGWIGRRRKWIASAGHIARRPRPRWAAIQDDYWFQTSIMHRQQPVIDPTPIEFTRRRLHRAPIDALTHPLHAIHGQPLQGSLAFKGCQVFHLHRYAQLRAVVGRLCAG